MLFTENKIMTRKEMETKLVLSSLIKAYQKLLNSGYSQIEAKRRILENYSEVIFTIYMEVDKNES